MKILITGGGAREHALGWKIKQDNPDTQLYFSPGNAGTYQLGTNILASTIDTLADVVITENIDLTIVGSEDLLVEGIVDYFQARGLKIFGPDKKSAILEGSKVFAKNFMLRHGIKTAKYGVFNNFTQGVDYLEQCDFPVVVKADGLASGKGVLICQNKLDAIEILDKILNKNMFGKAGEHVVIEEYLEGFEASILSIFNGKEIVPFLSAKDHKKIGDGETGLNTGGMGVVAPNPLFTEENNQDFIESILNPTLKGLMSENLIFSGVIFFGLMVTKKGVYLLEYNLRMGDPETQALLPLMKTNLLEIIEHAINGESMDIEWWNKNSVCVVVASGGYPLNFEKGFEIRGLDTLSCPSYFIAGARMINERIYTNSGRVLSVVGIGATLDIARELAYENLKKVNFDFKYFRTDIGKVN